MKAVLIMILVLGVCVVAFVAYLESPNGARLKRDLQRDGLYPGGSVPDCVVSDNRSVPECTPRSEYCEPRSVRYSVQTSRSDYRDDDFERQTREVVKSFIPVDDAAFDAAKDLMEAKRGSAEERNAQGRLLRESTKAAGRMMLDSAKEAASALKSKDFWRGLRGKK